MRNVMTGAAMAALLMAATPAMADSSWNFSLAGTTDYIFRGQSQSDRNPALQASAEWNHSSGLLAGVWASSIDFATDPGANVEIDLYVGLAHEFNETTSGDVKITYYWYPSSDFDESNYIEIAGSLTHEFGFFSGTVTVAYSPDYFFESSDSVWLSAGVEVPITDWLAASGNVGHQWIDDNAAFGTPDWFTYDIGLVITHDFATLDLRYYDTDIDKADCFAGSEVCEGRFAATLTFEFSTAEEE